MKKLIKNKMYRILWKDIECFNEWLEESEVDEKVKSADEVIEISGYYYGENETYLFFTHGTCKLNNGKYQYFNLTKINKSVIVKII